MKKKGIGTIAPEKNYPPVRVRVWVKVRFSLKVGGQFSSGPIVLETKKSYIIKIFLFEYKFILIE